MYITKTFVKVVFDSERICTMQSRWRCDRCYRWKIRAMMSIDYLCFVCDREQLRIYKPKENITPNIDEKTWKSKTPGNWSESLNQEITSQLSYNSRHHTQDEAVSRKRPYQQTSMYTGTPVVVKAQKVSSNS